MKLQQEQSFLNMKNLYMKFLEEVPLISNSCIFDLLQLYLIGIIYPLVHSICTCVLQAIHDKAIVKEKHKMFGSEVRALFLRFDYRVVFVPFYY
jgi:hypothetical protein